MFWVFFENFGFKFTLCFLFFGFKSKITVPHFFPEWMISLQSPFVYGKVKLVRSQCYNILHLHLVIAVWIVWCSVFVIQFIWAQTYPEFYYYFFVACTKLHLANLVPMGCACFSKWMISWISWILLRGAFFVFFSYLNEKHQKCIWALFFSDEVEYLKQHDRPMSAHWQARPRASPWHKETCGAKRPLVSHGYVPLHQPSPRNTD